MRGILVETWGITENIMFEDTYGEKPTYHDIKIINAVLLEP